MHAEAARLEGILGDRDSWRANRCSMERAWQMVGNRTTLLLVREAFYGTRRFDEFARRAEISEAVAAARLRELVSVGILHRTPYREAGQRTRHEYELTQMGRDLLPVTMALMRWGDRYLADDSGPALLAVHRDCRSPVMSEVRCESGHSVGLDELSFVAADPDGQGA